MVVDEKQNYGGGIAMKHRLFVHICVLALLGATMSTMTLGERSAAIARGFTQPTPTDAIVVPSDTDSIVREMLFGFNNPKEEAQKLLHNIFIALKDNQNLSDKAKKKLNHIKAILKRCIDDKSSMADWLNLKNINFRGIISDQLLEDIETQFSGIAFALRLQTT